MSSPVTIGERYSSATDSSNLRVTSERRGDADLLIAAGWLGERLGASLFRLMSEFDGVKGEHGIAQAEFDRAERAACELDKTQPDTAERIRADARAQAITARALILVHLKTLRETKQAVGAYAQDLSARLATGLGDLEVYAVAGQCLDIFLDPNCHHCQGRGKNGGFGQPEVLCRPCGAVGRRSARSIGKDEKQRLLGAVLLEQMDRILRQAGAGMRRFTREI